MEVDELEEGEACSYNDNSDYGGCIDPDIDLSYIDEKLRNVLGHFQKDFEGGVSAENLGAKFGGYGSFLPTYQRSPVLSVPRTPLKLQSCTVATSPINIQGQPSSSVPKKASISSSKDSMKPKRSMKSKKSNRAEISDSRNKKSVMSCNQNSLKFRIKVGPDKTPGEKNAAIYSGLGLDLSPSSSLDNSLEENEGRYHEVPDSPSESLADILMVMTSFAVEDLLLSPLSDDLIRYIESEKVEKESEYENGEKERPLTGKNVKRRERKSSRKDKGRRVSDSNKKDPEASRSKNGPLRNEQEHQLNVLETKKKCYRDFFGEMEECEEDDQKEDQNNVPLPVTSKSGFHDDNDNDNNNDDDDASLVKSNHVLVKEHWVECDKCKKWRLLPLGISLPNNLPEKWLCSMLDWLPRMNDCNIPQDETTEAVWALYQAPPLNEEDDLRKKMKNEMAGGPHKKRNGSIHRSPRLSEEKRKHKQKSDPRKLKITSKRHGEDRESSLLAKKMKTESFLFSDQNQDRVVVTDNDSAEMNRKRTLRESEDSRVYKEEMSENEKIERKKARKESETSSSKRERVRNPIAATSSSRKASPVESVSSSPMRVSDLRTKGEPSRRSNGSLPRRSGKTRSSPRQTQKKKETGGDEHSRMDTARPDIPKHEDAVREKAARLQTRSSGEEGSRVMRKNMSGTYLRHKELTSSQVAHNALKEAKDLKHTADRLKNTVSNLEHIELYFQACLKFLHGAFILETSSDESGRQGDTMIQSMKIYSSTANLCGFCAHEYEKSKEMGAAALAYKCMEVAYMRVIHSSYSSVNRHRSELQTSFQMVPTGESPSSSASDVDNVNHSAVGDKVGAFKGAHSPLLRGNHVLSLQSRANILRLLQFTQNVSLAMDASRKSRAAMAGSSVGKGEGTVSIKRALDHDFHDIEGLLRLVRLAMEANNR